VNGRRLWALAPLFALLFALLPALACSSGSRSPYPYQPLTGAGGTSVKIQPSGTVAVAFLSPPTPPDGSTVATKSDVPVGVTVDIQNGSDFVDTNSVKAALTASGITSPVATGQLVSVGGDVFKGTVSLGSLLPGSYTLTVTAASSTGATGQVV